MSQKNDETKQKLYVAPKLLIYGAAAELTAAGSMGDMENSGSMAGGGFMA